MALYTGKCIGCQVCARVCHVVTHLVVSYAYHGGGTVDVYADAGKILARDRVDASSVEVVAGHLDIAL